MIQLTNDDCMNVMPLYKDNYFDLALVDIEYCIGASKPSKKPSKVKQKNGSNLSVKSNNYDPKEWDFKKSNQEYFDELFRVSKNQMIFGGNYYGLEGGYLIWDKLNGGTDQYDCEMCWVSDTKRTDIVYYMWSGMIQGAYCGKDIRKALRQKGDKTKNEKRIHPTQKPVVLYEWILLNYAKPGFKIIDTHLGSGSIAVACDNLGFSLLGIEKDYEYFQDAFERLKTHQSQLKMML